MGQDARENPDNIVSEKKTNINTQLNFDIDHMLGAFENATIGIDSSDQDRAIYNLWVMGWYYSDYQKNLAILNDNSSDYNAVDRYFSNAMNTTVLIILESEDSYYNYKVLKIYEAYNDSGNRDTYALKLTNSSANLDSLTDDIYTNVSFMKRYLGNIGYSTSPMDKGIANLRHHNQMVELSAVDPTVGLEKNYAPYDGLGVDGYQEIFNYYSNKDEDLPESLEKLIIPSIRVPLNITLNISQETACYEDTVVLYGTLTTTDAKPLSNRKVYCIFNDEYVSNTTDKNGDYRIMLMIDNFTQMGTHNISVYSGPYLTKDTFLEKSWSNQRTLTMLQENVSLSIHFPQQMYTIGDNVHINGTATTSNGTPIKGADIQVMIQDQEQKDTSGGFVIGNNTTDLNGSYNITYRIPESNSASNYSLYAQFTPMPNTVLCATTSDRVQLPVTIVEQFFVLNNINIIYFKDDIIGIKGRIVTSKGQNISGSEVHASLSDIPFDEDITDSDGEFTASYVVTSGDTPGLKSLTLWMHENESVKSDMTSVRNIIVIPYDKTMVMLVLSAILLSVPLLAAGSSSLWQRNEKSTKKRPGSGKRGDRQ